MIIFIITEPYIMKTYYLLLLLINLPAYTSDKIIISEVNTDKSNTYIINIAETSEKKYDIMTATGELLNPMPQNCIFRKKGALDPYIANSLICLIGTLVSWGDKSISPYTAPLVSLGYAFSTLGLLQGFYQNPDHYKAHDKVSATASIALSWMTSIPIAFFPEYAGPLTMTYFTGASVINIYQKYYELNEDP